MALKLSIPESVPVEAVEQVLRRVRSELVVIRATLEELQAASVPSLYGYRWLKNRLRTLEASERAWLNVLDGAA